MASGNTPAIVFLAEFWKDASKRPRIFAQEPGDSQVSGQWGVNKHSGLALLVGLIVKLSPRANSPWVGKRPPCQSLGEGAAKAWYCPLVLLWESQWTRHVCLKFVMADSFNVWSPLTNESIPLKHVLRWGVGGGSRGGDVALHSLLTTCISLKHPLSCRAFQQLECMAKSRVSFWWTRASRSQLVRFS